MKAALANPPLAEMLDRYTRPAAPELVRTEGDRVRCLACGHRCLIGAEQRGICKVRFHDGERLQVPFGYVAGLQCDPVEKKPFFHVHPGSDALTFGMMGCDLHCSYCQNWVTSQALRDPAAAAPVREATPRQLIDIAKREGARLVVSSYNEPLITAEWAAAVFEQARSAELDCAFVSNGNATPEVLDFLRPWIVAYKVDLKSFNDRHYRQLGGVLDNITRTIRMIHERGIWLEVVTLVISGFNDGDEELGQIASFLASVSRDIPWHVTAFHKDYHMTDPAATPAETLIRAAEIGSAAGLRFIYAGNLPGRVGKWENTRCPSCQETLIDRFGYLVRAYHVDAAGRCPRCQTPIPGIWPSSSGAVKMGQDQAAYLSRLPRSVLHDRRQGLPVVDAINAQLPMTQSNEGAPAMATENPSAVSEPVAAKRSPLTLPQQERLTAALARILWQQACGTPVSFPAELADIGDLMVAGAFVSLKRGKHLRGCCGSLNPSNSNLVPLRAALLHAVERTVWDDERFPPISPGELDFLDMEIWLLSGPQQVQARGEERVDAVIVGTHGIQVVRGPARGLFLPGVAVEFKWDSRTFLDRVCMKAGLPATAWKEDDVDLFTFDGEVVRSSFAAAALTPSPLSWGERGRGEGEAGQVAMKTGPCEAADLQMLAALCRGNLADLLNGVMPRHFVGAPDGRLNGAILTLHRSDSGEPLSFHQISLRQPLALQATLFSLVQRAAQHLAREGITPQVFESLSFGLTCLSEPMLHGTVHEADLAGFDPKKRGLLVLERNKTGLAFDVERPATELLSESAKLARVNRPEQAMVFSLAGIANVVRASVSTAPIPVRGPAVRQPGVAGKFYPADPTELARMVDELLVSPTRERGSSLDDETLSPSLARRANGGEPWAAAMVPHAGLQFSGRIAAGVLKRINIPKTVIVIGPNHTGRGVDWAVSPQQTWRLPGIEMAADFVLARRLCEAIAGLEMDAVAHEQEHAIEVELPLLARLAPETRVVGITIQANCDIDGCRRFAHGLAEVMRECPEQPLLLISSDMNHFASDAENRRLDALALAALDRLDAEELLSTVNGNNISMCGVLPAAIVLETLKLLGKLTRAERAGYATSADVTGDVRRVVGYAGMLFN